MKLLATSLFFLVAASIVNADVILSVGYYDLAPPAGGNTGALPNPWYGSPNTNFFGSVSDATASDPDEAAILFTNTGTAAVTLGPGVTVTAGATSYTLWDSFIGAGFSILPGTSVILSGTAGNGFDGSDIGLLDSNISFSLNGSPFSATDTNSILHGWPGGSANETEPWTPIGDFLGSQPSVPEPATFGFFALGLIGSTLFLRKR